MMEPPQSTDAIIAASLSRFPIFRSWSHQPLDRQWRTEIGKMDHQTLMSLTAYALHRLMQQQRT